MNIQLTRILTFVCMAGLIAACGPNQSVTPTLNFEETLQQRLIEAAQGSLNKTTYGDIRCNKA